MFETIESTFKESYPVDCRHCREKAATRPRGLCVTCYYQPAIRKRYPSTSKYGQRIAPEPKRVRPARFACIALPGSPAKLMILAQRRERGEELEHPGDRGEMDLQGLGALIRRVMRLPALSRAEGQRRAIDSRPVAA